MNDIFMSRLLVLTMAVSFFIMFVMTLVTINNEPISGETVILGAEEVYTIHYDNLHKGKEITWVWEVEKDLPEPKPTLIFWIEDEYGNKVNEVKRSKDEGSFTMPYTSNWTVIWENPYPKASDGLFSLKLTYIVELTNKQPIISIQATPTSGVAPLTVSFSGNGVDYDGIITSYHWDFGDGCTSDRQNPTHTFLNAGMYKVTLSVTDNDGGMGEDTLNIIVITKQIFSNCR